MSSHGSLPGHRTRSHPLYPPNTARSRSAPPSPPRLLRRELPGTVSPPAPGQAYVSFSCASSYSSLYQARFIGIFPVCTASFQQTGFPESVSRLPIPSGSQDTHVFSLSHALHRASSRHSPYLTQLAHCFAQKLPPTHHTVWKAVILLHFS